LVKPQNQGRRFVGDLALKSLRWFPWFCLKTGGDGFLRFDLKTNGDSFSRFDLKIGGSGFPVCASKPVGPVLVIWVSKSLRRIFWFGSQNWQFWFDDFGLKITTTVS
jgi:hypothetical protein